MHRAVIVGAAFAALISCASLEPTPAPSDVIAAYREISDAKGFGRDKAIVKWNSELRMTTVGAAWYRPSIVSAFQRVVNDSADAAGLTVRKTDENPNVILIVTGPQRDDLDIHRKLLEPAYAYDKSGDALTRGIEEMKKASFLCHFYTVSNPDNEMTYMALVISADVSGVNTPSEWCIAKSMMRGMGLGGRSTKRPSVSNATEKRGRLTSLDRAMIATYYRREILRGVTTETAAETMSVILGVPSERPVSNAKSPAPIWIYP